MIEIKTIVEITGVCTRNELKKEFQKMTLKELREVALANSSVFENKIKNAVGDLCNVNIKDVVVMESKK